MAKFYASDPLDRSFHQTVLGNMVEKLFKPGIVASSTIKDKTAEIALSISKEELLHLFGLGSIDEKTFLKIILPRTTLNPWSMEAGLMIREIPNRDNLTVELSLEKL